ncbi:ABC transporter substrate-binding protein [Bifidobacterium sp. UTBIF-78]|nr:ABC transporter substrate-binding protein [Bifidobacterium sp. UTBIF-78]
MIADRVRRRFVTVTAAALVAGLTLAGCGQVRVTTVTGAPEGPTIAIGVSADEPALGVWHDGAYEGFDVDVAKYVATELGYANKQIVFKQVRPGTRQSMLDDGSVDMVVASWPITAASSAAVEFAGPYLETGMGLLVRADDYEGGAGDGAEGRNRGATDDGDAADAKAEPKPDDFAGGVVCAVTGDETALAVQREHPETTLQERDSYAQCVTALQVGAADAIASDLAILSGLRAANGPQYMAMIAGEGTVRYGIAVGKGNPQLAQKIAEALQDMVEDGTLAAARTELRRRTGLETTLVGDPKAIVSDAESSAD